MIPTVGAAPFWSRARGADQTPLPSGRSRRSALETEEPALYPLLLELLDAEGQVLQAECASVGFRSVGIADGQLRVNGKPIVVCGAPLPPARLASTAPFRWRSARGVAHGPILTKRLVAPPCGGLRLSP